MAFESYNDFLSTLEKNGELRRITFPVATELEITEIADREMKIPAVDRRYFSRNLQFKENPPTCHWQSTLSDPINVWRSPWGATAFRSRR